MASTHGGKFSVLVLLTLTCAVAQDSFFNTAIKMSDGLPMTLSMVSSGLDKRGDEESNANMLRVLALQKKHTKLIVNITDMMKTLQEATTTMNSLIQARESKSQEETNSDGTAEFQDEISEFRDSVADVGDDLNSLQNKIKTFEDKVKKQCEFAADQKEGMWRLQYMDQSPLEGTLAYRKSAQQSSFAAGGMPSRAVDGKRHTNYNDRTCTHTSKTQSPWWRVDLGNEFVVNSVSLTNRALGSNNELISFDIHVSSSEDFASAKLCYYHENMLAGGETRMFLCWKPLIGRFVRVQLRQLGVVTLCEVTVAGSKISDLGRYYPASQSSNVDDAGLAVNGNSDECSSTTTSGTEQWWQINLLTRFTVESVTVYAKISYNIVITLFDQDPFFCRSVKGTVCYEGKLKGGSAQTLSCSTSVTGKYVRIKAKDLKNQALSLCNVVVKAKGIVEE